MEYNVGDKVRIRKDLNFKGYEVTPTMKLDEGKTAEIPIPKSINKRDVFSIDFKD